MLCLALITDKRRISTFHLIYLFKLVRFCLKFKLKSKLCLLFEFWNQNVRLLSFFFYYLDLFFMCNFLLIS